MSVGEIRKLLRQMLGSDEAKSLAARIVIYSRQEDAVNPLVDVFYAGVDESTGLLILELIADIGGPDAMAVLRNIYNFEDDKPNFQRAAIRGLLRNRNNLDKEELEELLGSIGDY
jgi:hypothetical protein